MSALKTAIAVVVTITALLLVESNIAVAAGSSWQWPVGCSWVHLTQGYSAGHEGLDVVCLDANGEQITSGVQVIAARSGRVYRSGFSQWYGWNVVLDHENGWYSYYGHLAGDPGLVDGQHVLQGALIGEMGDTGTTAGGVHLHFEMRTTQGNGWVRYNPLDYLPPLPETAPPPSPTPTPPAAPRDPWRWLR